MNLKNLLKRLKLNESTISMVLGALVIIIVGMLVVNYFRSVDDNEILPDGASTEDNQQLPTTHIVEEGETLWSISELYYDSGYNWVDIQQANELANPGDIEAGQEITIPVVEVRDPLALGEVETTPEPTLEPETEVDETASPEPTAEPTEEPTSSPTMSPTPEPTEEPEEVMEEQVETDIEGESYTVVAGDTLWDIAVRAYGDGHRWTDIASANELVNPNLIHPGNVFILPR